jgi:hypothetical protein
MIVKMRFRPWEVHHKPVS